MGLGSRNLKKVVIPYANSPSTNPDAKVNIIRNSAKKIIILFAIIMIHHDDYLHAGGEGLEQGDKVGGEGGVVMD